VKRRIEEIARRRKIGVTIAIEHKPGYPPTSTTSSARALPPTSPLACAASMRCKDNARPSISRDFSYMLERVPGAMV
jgi:hypothetical protein